MPGLLLGLTDYFLFYNEERLHQSLDYTTPNKVYRTGTGGGAMIVDKFNNTKEISTSTEGLRQRHSSVM